MMEFNPLDLLASAAELQQRHDDPPSNMTRQRKGTTLASKIITINSAQKENKDANKNSSKNNGVIIVKKIKIGASSDLEKMLDEHNYGNAKKGIKFEKNVQTVSNDNCSQGIVSSVSYDREHELSELRENKAAETVSVTTGKPDGLPVDNVQTNSSVLSISENIQSSISKKCETSQPLPEVETKKTDFTNTTLSERCPSAADCPITGVPRGHSPDEFCDKNLLQTNSLLKNSDSKLDNAEANNSILDVVLPKENTISVPCKMERNIDASDQSPSSTGRKVTVEFGPQNNILIEKTDLNESKSFSPVNHQNDRLVSDTHSVETMSERKPASSHKFSVEEKSDIESSHLKDQNNIKSVTIIRSLLTTNNTNGRCVRTAKLSNGSLRVSCDTENYLRDLKEKMDTCDSPKSRLELDPFCSASSNGIHLLSPDRRNPDSVGIAESPVTSAFTDSSNSYETETDIEKDENSSLSPAIMSESSKITLKVCDETVVDTKQSTEILNTEIEFRPEKLKLEVSETDEFGKGKQKIRISVKEPAVEQKHYQSTSSNCEKEKERVFRFESDHCYAGLPGNVDNGDMRQSPDDEETDSDEEEEDEASSVSVSPTEMSQDSGYGDVTQSPECEKKDDSTIRHPTEKLVPVLISFNKSGSLTVHTDKGVSKELPKQIFTLSENQSLDTNANLLNSDKAQNLNSSVRPLLLSPIGKGTASVLIDPSKIIVDPKKASGIISPSVKGLTSQTPPTQISPPKFGKFRIGTFASFSNTGMDLDSPVKEKKLDRSSKAPPFPRSSSVSTLKSPVNKIRQIDSYKGSSSSLLTAPVAGYANHIQHDHDYCLHSLMPSTIDSAKENNSQKDSVHKTKSSHLKTKKSDSELQKNDKYKRKAKSIKNLVEKDDSVDDLELMLDEERYRDLPTFAETMRAKTRTEKYIEQKSSEPKMKITGSSNFQDQFVYFMNTKKRSRRRESRDGHTPLQVPFDRIILPPHKPGDIVVPHLTDADIENLKLFNKQGKTGSQISQTGNSDPFNSKSTLPNSSHSGSSEINADEESKIINTILSLENENLTEEQVPYSENMEMYGQSDIMGLLPEQMNLTQEQMDLLFSAVDEVQNSSPSLVSDKLTDAVSGDTTFGQFPVENHTFTNPLEEKSPVELSGNGEKSRDSAPVQNNTGEINCDKDLSSSLVTEESVPLVDGNKCPSSAEETGGHGLASKLPVEEQEDSPITKTASASSLSSDSNDTIIDKPSAPLSADTNDVDTKETFPSIGTNLDTSTEHSLNQPNTSLAFSNLPSSVNPELPLPTLYKSSPLDIFGSEYKLDRSDLFPEAALQESAAPVPTQGASIPVPTPLDYTAPWIVTVSMYWNDLPAIMINNLPFVRLVDIHKQILPAKDTGILKKRCQLMGIEVGNCSEMQRYFLVQYGKAVNSKSTLIVSKDAAKVLIGYYVDPQPTKGLNPIKEHKSIIEHRREQLRRIALAKRAALRAERLEKERAAEAEAGSNLLKPVDGDQTDLTPGAQSLPQVSSRQRSQSLSSRFQQSHTPGTKPQRSTRHKKINFLELLRGDSSSNLPEDEHLASDGQTGKKKPDNSTGTLHVKPGSKRKRCPESSDGKVKVVRYTESESSESCEEYEVTSEDVSDSSESEKEVVVVKKSKKKRTSLLSRKAKKTKYKKSVVLKRNVVKVPSFKVKFKSLAKVHGKQVSKEQVKSETVTSHSNVQIVKLYDGEKSGMKKHPEIEAPLKNKDILPLKVDITAIDCKEANSYKKAGVEVEVINNVNDFHVSSVDSDISPDQVMNSDSENNLDTIDDEKEDTEKENMGAQVQQNEGDSADIATDLHKDKKSERKKDSDSDISEDKELDHSDTQVKQTTDTESAEQQVNEDIVNTSVEEIDKSSLDNAENIPIASCSSSEDMTDKNSHETNIPIASCSISEDMADKHENDMENNVYCKNQSPVQEHDSEIDTENSGKNDMDKLMNISSDKAETPVSGDSDNCSEIVDTSVKKVDFFLLNKESDIPEEIPPVRIVHRDASPDNSNVRSKRQLGEVFVEHYNNKRSFCIRCYTCRKMMSVDHFMRHLHDVSGGLVSTDLPQIIEPSDPDMTDCELKAWEVFQRKKELFDNNQLPSDVARSNITYSVDSDSNQSFAEKTADETARGPIIIQTPVSPVKGMKVKAISKPDVRAKKKISTLHQPKTVKTLEKSVSWSTVEGIRASSRKRKASHLLSSDDYTFGKKLPRLQKDPTTAGNENGMDVPDKIVGKR